MDNRLAHQDLSSVNRILENVDLKWGMHHYKRKSRATKYCNWALYRSFMKLHIHDDEFGTPVAEVFLFGAFYFSVTAIQ